MRGLLLSLDPLRDQAPALGPALRALERSLASLEALSQGVHVLKVEPKVTVANLEWVLAATRAQLDRMPRPAPYLVVDWRCPPPALPGSVISLGSSLAACALQLASASEVCLTIRKSPGWAQIEFAPHPGSSEPAGRHPAETSLELAAQVIRAHGGRIERVPAPHGLPRLCVWLPTTLKIPAFWPGPDRAGSDDEPAREDGSAVHGLAAGLPGLGSRPTDGGVPIG